jgi:CRISPR-associated protein Csb2
MTVRWLAQAPAPAYHGREWPPSPHRLFCALVAGVHGGGVASEAHNAALRYLAERREPPTIEVPVSRGCSPVASAVPNNDYDVALDVATKKGRIQADHAASSLITTRHRKGRAVAGPIRYIWAVDAGAWDQGEALHCAARSLTALGQGVDQACATVTLQAQAPVIEGLAYRPDETGSRTLSVPHADTLTALRDREDARRDSIESEDPKRGARKPVVHCVADVKGDPAVYRGPWAKDLPKRRHVVFNLVDPEQERRWAALPGAGMATAAMARHALAQSALAAGLDWDARGELLGHGGTGRVHAVPVPNAGHRWADGGYRHLMLVANDAVPERRWRSLQARVAMQHLVPDGQGEPEALLVHSNGEQEKVTPRYRNPGSVWETATPVILPCHLYRRGKARPEKAMRRLLAHAGYPQEAVESVQFHHDARVTGAFDPGQYQVPRCLKHFHRVHMTIRFHEPVDGPILLGAGVGWGLGLFVSLG